MAEGRFNDGLTARSHSVTVRVQAAFLAFGEHRWPLAQVREEVVGDRARLSLAGAEPARLTMALADWRDMAVSAPAYDRARRRREFRLVMILAAAAGSVATLIFVVIPWASGPLARHTPPALERQMGENLGAQLSVAFPTCPGRAGQVALSRLGQRLESGGATPFHYRVQAVHSPTVNAFALPGGSIMVTDRLIALAATPDELAAVIAHEAAHVRARHVMQGLWRSFGFGMLLDAVVVGGGSGAGQQAVLLMGSMNSLRYGRAAEAEADARGQDLLVAQGLSSEGMATFFERLAVKGDGPEAATVRELMSDHPDSLRRARRSRSRARPGAAAFTPAEWASIKAVCKDPPTVRERFRRCLTQGTP